MSGDLSVLAACRESGDLATVTCQLLGAAWPLSSPLHTLLLLEEICPPPLCRKPDGVTSATRGLGQCRQPRFACWSPAVGTGTVPLRRKAGHSSGALASVPTAFCRVLHAPAATPPSRGPCTASLTPCGLFHLIRPQRPPESGWTQSKFHPLDFGIGNKRKKASLFTCLGFSLVNSRALSRLYEGQGKLVQREGKDYADV